MRHLITTITFLASIGSPLAIAQTATNTNTASSDAANQQRMREAPVGHRQPRGVLQGKNVSDVNILPDKEDIALDRRLRSICRGC